jgi:hypothetical protein
MSPRTTKRVEKPKRAHKDTTVSLSPLTVDEALKALLQTPPPTTDQPVARKASKKRKLG